MSDDSVEVRDGDLRMTHSGLELDCPDCNGWHLLSRYVGADTSGNSGCSHREKPASDLTLITERGEADG